MKKYRIFISGAQKELKEKCRAVKDFIPANPLLAHALRDLKLILGIEIKEGLPRQ